MSWVKHISSLDHSKNIYSLHRVGNILVQIYLCIHACNSVGYKAESKISESECTYSSSVDYAKQFYQVDCTGNKTLKHCPWISLLKSRGGGEEK